MTITIDLRTEMVITLAKYEALVAASSDDAKRLYNVDTISKLFDVNKRTLQKLASEKPMLITKDATGKYKASLKKWKLLLGV